MLGLKALSADECIVVFSLGVWSLGYLSNTSCTTPSVRILRKVFLIESRASSSFPIGAAACSPQSVTLLCAQSMLVWFGHACMLQCAAPFVLFGQLNSYGTATRHHHAKSLQSLFCKEGLARLHG